MCQEEESELISTVSGSGLHWELMSDIESIFTAFFPLQ